MSWSGVDHMAISGQSLPIAIVGWSIVMARIVLVIWVGTVASADDRMVRMSNSPGTIGKLVKDREGKVLGRIHDVVFHWRSDGYTEYVVLSLGGFWGVGEDHVAVPWEVLTPSTRKEHFVVNTNQVQLSEDHELVGYRFYDRSFAAVLRGGRSTASSAAGAMMDNIESAATASGTSAFGIQHTMEQNYGR
jgi:sporulation protein YlmC with PRC-barrel domain